MGVFPVKSLKKKERRIGGCSAGKVLFIANSEIQRKLAR